MESMESHEAGFPPFPHSLEIPSGLPHFHGLDDWVYVFSCPLYSNHRYRKGLVTDVSGPQRNACPGTLNGKERGRPLRAAPMELSPDDAFQPCVPAEAAVVAIELNPRWDRMPRSRSS